MNFFLKAIFVAFLFFSVHCFGQFPPPAGQPGTTAIHKDSSIFIDWATHCHVIRGWQNIADTALGFANVGDSTMATDIAGNNGVVSLGDGGIAILTFEHPIVNGPGWDFAVFENAFSDTFLELAFVEVSSDGNNFYRFPSVSLTDTTQQVSTFGELDATKIHNLAGKYRVFYGTPFDLEELKTIPGLDINHITHIKIQDVVGSLINSYASYDALGNKINDPWPTPFGSSGFDLDAVGVINNTMNSMNEISKEYKDIIIYPNPVKNHLYISMVNYTAANASLLDINNNLLLTISLNQHITAVNTQNLLAGIYILKIKTQEKIVIQKIIKI